MLVEDDTARLKDLLVELDHEKLLSTGDLSGIGMIGGTLEEKISSFSNDSVLQNIVKLICQTCDALILQDIDDYDKGLEKLSECLKQITTNENPDLKCIEKCLKNVLGIEDSGKKEKNTQDDLNVSPPAPDKVTIHDDDDKIVYNEFIHESIEHLENIEMRVLDLEKDPTNSSIIDNIFRAIHSIKGAAGFIGLSTTNALCHELETLLDRGRKRTMLMTQEVIDVILSGLDLLKQLMGNLSILLADALSGKGDVPVPSVDVTPAIKVIRILIKRSETDPSLQFSVDPDKFGGKLVADGLIKPEDLQNALQQQKPVGQILVDMGALSKDQVEAAAKERSAPKPIGSSTIKVDTSKLDNLMEIVGELVISQSQVAQDDIFRGGQNHNLSKKITELTKITTSMQDMVMSIRMVPLRNTFQKMNRLIRDTTQKTGKEAKLIISGEETEIDKTVIDELADPLVHILRNAVDHGIDLPEERKKAGKDPCGTVKLMAYQQGGNVVIEVTDDGRGLNRDRILEKAIEKGIAESDKTYTDKEIFEFVLQPGFSTAQQVTSISGRGVGMDVVKRNIEKLGGRVEIKSESGKGSAFIIRLPLTMAIVDGMVVLVGHERFVIPTLSIEESIRPTKEMVKSVKGKGQMIEARNRLIPLVRLDEHLCNQKDEHQIWEKLAIIVRSDDMRVGIVVDSLLGQQQVVIKSLGENLRGIRGISGGCILGDGRVALIVDVAGLVILTESWAGSAAEK